MNKILRQLEITGPALFFTICCCCGYSTRSLLPAHLKNVYIDIFENRTIKIGLGEAFTNELIRQFTSDGTLRVTNEGRAQLKISGVINYFNKEPYVYGGDQTVYKYKTTVTCKITCLDATRNTLYWEGEVSDWAIFGQNEDESVGINEALTKVAKETVRRILTNW